MTDLKVGLAGEPLLAVAALPVLDVLVDRLDVPEELRPVREVSMVRLTGHIFGTGLSKDRLKPIKNRLI